MLFRSEEVTIVSDQSGPWRGSASLEGTKAALGLGTYAGYNNNVTYYMERVSGDNGSFEVIKEALGLGANSTITM